MPLIGKTPLRPGWRTLTPAGEHHSRHSSPTRLVLTHEVPKETLTSVDIRVNSLLAQARGTKLSFKAPQLLAKILDAAGHVLSLIENTGVLSSTRNYWYPRDSASQRL